MGQTYPPRKEMILMQIHICRYVSEESTHLCIKQQVDTPDGKAIVIFLHTHVRRNHCSVAIDEQHKCSTAAMTVTERKTMSGQHPNPNPQFLQAATKTYTVVK